ncbi:phytanoyl-CoA dioxygenase family protein [bacterium]|nr:phytanoyl-CoA dioxygenase family protein [bacterium]
MQVPQFRDSAARETFERTGYVVVPRLLADDIPQLQAVYEEMLSGMPATDPYFQIAMTGTNCVGSPELRRHVCAEVARIVAPRLDAVLDDYRFVGAGFRVKQVGADSRLPQHQDPTMVDEDRFWSINIIAPIIDTTVENGALQVVPGSHRIMPKVRSLDLDDRAETYDLHEVIEPLVRTVPLRAGDAIFYYNALLHGSGPNMSTAPRPLVIGTLMSRESPMTVYFRKPGQPRTVERYEVPDDYFNRMEHFDRDHRLRPQIGRRIDDAEDTYALSRDDMIAAFRALAAELS